ncbi:MAG: radical SAM protein [Myxococcales bacterium]
MKSRINVFVHHLRGGFATNCSSSHSLLYLPGTPDDLTGVHENVYDWGFVLATRAAKLPYIRFQLEAAEACDEALVAELGLPAEGAESGDYYSWSAPPELAKEIARWALMDGVVVLGGPDNGEYHTLSTTKAIDPASASVWQVRRDPLGFWTVIDEGGTKMRLSFSTASHPQVLPFRSTWPEMVDLKITDRCNAGCTFCYQDSRPDGAHARMEDILDRLHELKRAQVLEVVLGGGEPTEHPQFSRIVGEIQRRGMRAGFTTRQLDWRRRVDESQANWSEVRWAYSISSVDDAERVTQMRPNAHPAIHVVMGTEVSRPEPLRQVAELCKKSWLQLVLLGFKSKGRASSLTAIDDSHWFDVCAAAGLKQVAIDAVLASKDDLELRRRGVPDWLTELDDGRYSMHVDAVRGTCGPSSFCAPEETFALPKGDDAIREAFDRINERLGPARLRRALELEQDAALAARDEKRLVMLDAAMEGRCEQCGAPGAEPVGGERGRPSLLCPRCGR